MKSRYIKSKYKGVSYIEPHFKDRFQKFWRFCLVYNKIKYTAYKDTEREAAISYDMKLIELGKDPVNILKKKI